MQEVEGVGEMPAFSWNFARNHGQVNELGRMLKSLWGMIRRGTAARPIRLLVYCVRGADRSGAFVTAMLAFALANYQQSMEDVVGQAFILSDTIDLIMLGL